jgi:hypothetical protein
VRFTVEFGFWYIAEARRVVVLDDPTEVPKPMEAKNKVILNSRQIIAKSSGWFCVLQRHAL